MPLQPGEAAALIIRRSETDPTKYFLAVRRSITSSFHPTTNDFQLGPCQVPHAELMERTDYQVALDEAFQRLLEL